MKTQDRETEFDWDQANAKKIFDKHGIIPAEVEEIFLDPNLVILPDVKHSQTESRCIAAGQGLNKKGIHVVFTVRNSKIRVISARRMHRKEVRRYEKIKKDTTF